MSDNDVISTEVPALVVRPTMTAELFDTVCRLMAEETMSLLRISKLDGMPSRQSVLRWMDREDVSEEERERRRGQYARAREDLVRGWVEETVEIADDATQDIRLRKNRNGDEEEVFDREHVQRSKLRIEQRNWLAERLMQREFGSSQQIRHADADGGKLPDRPPPVIRLVVVDAPQRALEPPRNITPGVGAKR